MTIEKPSNEDAAENVLVCPRCESPVQFQRKQCASCGISMQTDPDGIFCIDGAMFPDWNHDQAKKALRDGRLDFYSSDELINQRFMKDFSIPLLGRVLGNSARNDVRVLSVGCGIGADVEILLGLGYDAWGTDCGSRTLFWPTRKYPDRLIRCTDEGMPFPAGYFDFVMCHQVLEHVGVIGDTMTLAHEWRVRRQRFLHNLLRVTKLGGYLNIATPNRLFPLDPGHAANFHGVRIHGPFDHFLTSYGDMRQYFKGHSVKAVTPLGYYAGTCTAIQGLSGYFTRYLNLLDRVPFLQSTMLNPLTNVLVQRHS